MTSIVHPNNLLFEARKSWNHILSDKAVYAVEEVDGKPANCPAYSYVKEYLRGISYIEFAIRFEFFYHGVRYDYVNLALLEIQKPTLPTNRRNRTPKPDSGRNCHDTPVLVEVNNFVENVEPFKVRPLRSVIWLKTFDYGVSAFNHVLGSTLPAVSILDVPYEGEIKSFQSSLSNGLFSVKKSESDVVKARPEVSGNISSDNRHIGQSFRLDTPVGLKVFGIRVVFSNESVAVWLVSSPSQSIDVYLRPLSLEDSTSERLHIFGVDYPPSAPFKAKPTDARQSAQQQVKQPSPAKQSKRGSNAR